MTTYYVDWKNGSNDTGTGATGAPWKTVTYANTQIVAGDTILVRGSSTDASTYYRDRAITLATPVTVSNDTGHTPVFLESTEFATWSKTDGRTNVYQANIGNTLNGCANGTTILEPVADVAACDAKSDTFYYDGANVLYVNIGGSAPTSVEVALEIGWIMRLGAGVTVNGLISQWVTASYLLEGDGATLSNCTVRYKLWDNNSGHLSFRILANNCTIKDCTINGLSRAVGTSYASYGIQVNGAYSGATIDGCTIYDEKVSFQDNGGTSTVVKNCMFVRPLQCGIVVEVANATLAIHDNRFVDCPTGILAATVHTDALSIYRNRFYSTSALAASLKGILLNGGGTYGIYHNVFANLGRGSGSNSEHGISLVPAAAGQLVTAKNNAFYGGRFGIRLEDIGNTPTLALDYNGFYGVTANFTCIDAGDQGSHNVTADPQYTDQATDDYRIGSGSPYFDTGVAVSGINNGYYGSAPDIGYYEVPVAGPAKRVAVRRSS